jgi:hypothetical protein
MDRIVELQILERRSTGRIRRVSQRSVPRERADSAWWPLEKHTLLGVHIQNLRIARSSICETFFTADSAKDAATNTGVMKSSENGDRSEDFKGS